MNNKKKITTNVKFVFVEVYQKKKFKGKTANLSPIGLG